MPVFMTISKHAPENCPQRSPRKHRKSMLELFDKMESLTKKHGVKLLGAWTDFPQHIVYMVFKGTFDAVTKLGMEPEFMKWLSFNSMEAKIFLYERRSFSDAEASQIT